MSETPALIAAKPLTAIELAEKQINELKVQYDQTLKQLHMIDGAVQGTTFMLNKLRAEAAKAAAVADEQAAPETANPSNVVEFPNPPQAS